MYQVFEKVIYQLLPQDHFCGRTHDNQGDSTEDLFRQESLPTESICLRFQPRGALHNKTYRGGGGAGSKV